MKDASSLPPPAGRVAFVLKGYPRLSETFIAQEIEALEARGLDIAIVSLRHPTDRAVHPVHQVIRAPLLYLPEYLHNAPARVWRAWRQTRGFPGYEAARRAWLADLRRDPTPNRVRRFGQALVLAAELPERVRRLHAHFLHTPASVARYAALMLGLDWSVSAHAKDIWTIPEWEKREKLASARWAVTCTETGRRHLAELAPGADQVSLCYHGLALDRFPAAPLRSPGPDGADALNPAVLLSVGRAVEKKGYDDLLDALALLPVGLSWRMVHIGGGPLHDELKRRAERLGVGSRVEWRGPQPQPEVLAAYRRADLFVLAAKIATNGDRDGLPNVLLEAQSQRVACVATNLPGIAELIEDGRTGLLEAPGDSRALAVALERLIRDPARRAALAAAGEERVRRDFDQRAGIDLLAARFGLSAAAPAEPPAAEEKSAAVVAPGVEPAGEQTAEAVPGPAVPTPPESAAPVEPPVADVVVVSEPVAEVVAQAPMPQAIAASPPADAEAPMPESVATLPPTEAAVAVAVASETTASVEPEGPAAEPPPRQARPRRMGAAIALRSHRRRQG